jgi:RNA polymerase sigma factor (sigma-70 family)
VVGIAVAGRAVRGVAVKPVPRSHDDARSDADLLAGIAAGDLDALGALYDRHGEPVHRFVARVTQGHADTDDIVHDAFLTAARIAGRFDGRPSARPWLIGIAARLVHRRARGLGRLARVLERFAWVRPSAPDPAAAFKARSTLGVVGEAVARMSPAKRVVLIMAEVEGMSGPEIAAALEIPLGTVWTRLHHARRELLQVLQEAEP